jgi:hypothetical protein
MHILPDNRDPPFASGDPSPVRDERPEDSPFWRIITGPWLGPILIVLGWGPLFAADIVIEILQGRGSVGPHFGVGYAMGWGTVIAFPATIVAICSMLFHLLRAVYRFFARR